MPENIKSAVNDVDITAYKDRERWDAENSNKDNPVSVSDRKFINAPANGTYVVLHGLFEGQACTNNYNPEDGSFTEENVDARATVDYIIHLGDWSSNNFSSFSNKRNYEYTYTITVNGVDDIVVEVENMLEDGVFDTLREQYPNVFISPKIEQYHRYKGKEDNIVVLKLISEAPKPKDGHSSTLEKLLVDLFSNKFTGRLIEHSEYPAIFEDVFNKYYLDEAKMFRYARRRNVESKIKRFMKENTITTEN